MPDNSITAVIELQLFHRGQERLGFHLYGLGQKTAGAVQRQVMQSRMDQILRERQEKADGIITECGDVARRIMQEGGALRLFHEMKPIRRSGRSGGSRHGNGPIVITQPLAAGRFR